ncbi:MAG TPA: radical SAM family heme chaperone HemW [Burkholderiales bacterium]|nr:radical SAM family heme chaperone HemW [Burkholderiales bacterium]
MAGAVAGVALSLPGTLRLAALPPLAVYVHLPWCVRKCPYCDFNSHERKGELPEDDYVDALIADLEGLLPSVWGRRATSVFLGGGTPSLFAPRSIDRLLSALRARLPLEPEAEVTLEANPGTAEAGRFAGYRSAGVNRLSLGVQSFDDRMLAALGRIHGADEAQRAIEMGLRHFDNVNVDLMYGLPGQTPSMARSDIDEALRWGPSHVSAYQLTIETNTVFYRKRPELPEHDLCADMQLAAEEALGGAGYEHYETSAFARAGRRSRHNLNYWQFGDYLGLGAGAHGKISFADRITRHARARQPREYMEAALRGTAGRGSLTEEQTVATRELPFEFMLNALRLVEGFPVELFGARTGLPLSAAQAGLAAAERQGLIERAGFRIRPSERGRLFLNELLALFLPGP